MIVRWRRFVPVALAFLLAACDSNADGPHAPPVPTSNSSDVTAPPPARKPLTKNRREIVNPD